MTKQVFTLQAKFMTSISQTEELYIIENISVTRVKAMALNVCCGAVLTLVQFQLIFCLVLISIQCTQKQRKI